MFSMAIKFNKVLYLNLIKKPNVVHPSAMSRFNFKETNL